MLTVLEDVSGPLTEVAYRVPSRYSDISASRSLRAAPTADGHRDVCAASVEELTRLGASSNDSTKHDR
jgi:hypothetical protein